MGRSLQCLALLLAFAGCGRDVGELGPDGMPPGDGMGPGDGPGDMMAGSPTAAELLAAIAACDNVVGGTFARDSGGTSDISICGLTGAVFWKADLDVDCDGKETPQCNLNTDPAFQAETAATDSNGDFLDAANLPYVVVPGISGRFDFTANGLDMGSVVAVIYKDKVVYGPLGDIGPSAIIGESSYAMAQALGIDPDPSTGGTDDEVAYIAFTDSAVDPIENHDAAVALGIARAQLLLH